jgi:hypothetical protein
VVRALFLSENRPVGSLCMVVRLTSASDGGIYPHAASRDAGVMGIRFSTPTVLRIPARVCLYPGYPGNDQNRPPKRLPFFSGPAG